jgi:hypothetical protein
MNWEGKIKRGFSFILGSSAEAYPWYTRFRIAGNGLASLVFKKKAWVPPDMDNNSFLKQAVGFDNLQDYVDHIRRREKPRFFTLSAAGLKESVRADFARLYPKAKDPIISDAGRILDHVFNLLGSGPKKVITGTRAPDGYEYIDWHTDFKSGFRWDKTIVSKNIKFGDVPGADVKVPWELSRGQHFPTLGKAYLLTGEERYAREFVNEISDWIENNPVNHGVNWACTMDVAIRAVNWLWGLYYFRGSPSVSDEFLIGLLKSLYLHGHFIMMNLEKDPLGRNSNHYLSDLAGLVYLGVLLPELKGAKKWRDYSVKELVAEAKKQVYSDGADYEGSISYHRLVTEIFLAATLLCLANGSDLPALCLKRVEKMVGFVKYYTRPDGKVPQIGDNDDGRLQILADYGNRDRADHRYLLDIGVVLFNRPDFKLTAGGFGEEAFWLLGEEGHRKYESLNAPETATSSAAFADSGFYIMRRDTLYFIVDCLNPNEKAPSGHRHNSRLSFELYAYDKSFIIDPGAYLYTPEPQMRDLFRGTAYHNTVVVDGREQNTITKGNLFLIGQEAHIKIHRWQVTDNYDILDVEHDGYQRLNPPVSHRRQILFNKREGCWIIRDILNGAGKHSFDLYFHFAPLELAADREFPLSVRTQTPGANLAIIPLQTGGISLSLEKGWISPSYGIRKAAPVARYSKNGQGTAIFCNILYPYQTDIDIKAVLNITNILDLGRYFGGDNETGV